MGLMDPAANSLELRNSAETVVKVRSHPGTRRRTLHGSTLLNQGACPRQGFALGMRAF